MAEGSVNVNFFRPCSDHARANMKLTILLVSIWAMAVFGFQVLLMITCGPEPEPAYEKCQSAWQKVEDGTATKENKQVFATTLLSVLGKGFTVKEKAPFREAFSVTAYDLLGSKSSVIAKVMKELEATRELLDEDAKAVASERLPDAEFNRLTALRMQKSTVVREAVAASVGLSNEGFDLLRAAYIPFAMQAGATEIGAQTKEQLPGLLTKYLVHNQGPLTKARFFGFPFHYWYTAQFLLILFVVICLIYVNRTDAIHRKYKFVEDDQ